MFTRKQYMDRECSHRQYYAQLVTPSTLAAVRSTFGAERLLASTDEHLNDIPRERWDALALRPIFGDFRKLGDFPTLAGQVCALKEAAQQLIDAARAQEVRQ